MSFIQSILFDKKKWSIPEAINWLELHGHEHYKIDITKDKYRFRQYNPQPEEYYRTIKIGHRGIEFIIGFEK